MNVLSNRRSYGNASTPSDSLPLVTQHDNVYAVNSAYDCVI